MNIFLKRVVSCLVTAAAVMSSVFVAPELFAGANVTASAVSKTWDDEFMWKQTSSISIDTDTVYGDNAYSIKITNTEYSMAWVTKTYKVQPNTKYVLSGYVRVTDFEADPGNKEKEAGAFFNSPWYSPYTKVVNSDKWTKLEWVYTTDENETEHTFCLCLGISNAICKGTAYFSGITFGKLDRTKWNGEYSYLNKGIFSVDNDTVRGSAPYSLKLDNTGYDVSYYQKTVSVKPGKMYRLSAYVKYSEYKLNPKCSVDSGAMIVIEGKSCTAYSSYTTSDKWVTLETSYYTAKNEKSINLQLFNGMFTQDCKGTAWFCDVKLEEAELSNQWTALTVIFKSIDVNVKLGGKNIAYKASFNSNDIKEIKELTNELRTTFNSISDGLVNIKSIYYTTVDTPIKSLSPYMDENGKTVGYFIDVTQTDMYKMLSELTEERNYNQIIAVAPLNGIAKVWWGLGGSNFKDIHFCEVTFETGDVVSAVCETFKDAVFVHEMLHGMESDSNLVNPKMTADLHAYADYGYTVDADGEFRTWYSDYIRAKLPGGKGIDPSVFKKPNGNYTLVSDDMTPGVGVSVSGTLPSVSDIASVITVSEIKDKYYNGKAVKPSVTVKGAAKGTDYTVSYADNKAPGTAKAIIKGKGKYTGTVEIKFNIKLKKTTAKISGKTLKWAEVPGADGYEVYYSKDGGKYKRLTDTTALKYDLSKAKKGTYKFKVRAYSNSSSGKLYADWSKVVKYTKK